MGAIKVRMKLGCNSGWSATIQRNRLTHFYRNDFLVDSDCPRICVDVGWWVSVSKRFVIGQSETNIHFKNVKTNHESIRGGDPPPHIHTNSGTIRIHETIISIKMGCYVTLYISLIFTLPRTFSGNF